MNTQQSAVALRIIIVAAVTGVDGDSLDQLSSFELPDGMLVSVVSGALYRLDKTSTAAASSAVGAVVAPGAGPGNFLALSGTGASASLAMQLNGTAALAGSAGFTTVANTWIALPAGTGFYFASAANVFTPSSSAGTLVYSGPDAAYRLTASATVESSTAADEVDLAIDTLSVLLGTTTFVGSAGATNAPATAPGAAVSTSIIRTLTAGETIQVLARSVGGHTLTVPHLNLIATPL